MFQRKVVGKIKTHILCSITVFRKSCRLRENVGKYCRAGQATDDSIVHAVYLRLQTHTHDMQHLLLFHYNNGCTNAPQCYVICTSPAWLLYPSSGMAQPASRPTSGSAVDHSPPSSAEVKNWVELHLNLRLYAEGVNRKNYCPLLLFYRCTICDTENFSPVKLTVKLVPTCMIENQRNTTNNCSGI
jgi:hypothetical protein